MADPKAVHLARRATLERFFRQHHMQTRLVAQRVRMIKAAVPLTTDEGVITPRVCLVRALVAQLRAILQAIEGFDHAIAQLAPTHPDFALLHALPGTGPVFAPRLLVGFGEQRDRYTSATELQQYAAIAPVTERSGETCWVHWRLQCSKFLRQTFVEWASESIRHSFWARAYYAQQWAKGSTHQAATRALAFKWTRFLYGVVNLLPVDMINEHEGTRPPGSSRLCGGGKARDVLPGVESFPHLLTVCGGGEQGASRAEVLCDGTIGGKGALCAPWRLEPLHPPFALAGGLVCVLRGVSADHLYGFGQIIVQNFRIGGLSLI